MEIRFAKFTKKLVCPVILWYEAVTAVLPGATAVAKPLLFTVATEESEVFQVTSVLISRVVPSGYVPEAVNCCVTSAGKSGFTGVTDID